MCMAYTDSIHARVRDFRAAVGPAVKNSSGPMFTVFSGHLFFPMGICRCVLGVVHVFKVRWILFPLDFLYMSIKILIFPIIPGI